MKVYVDKVTDGDGINWQIFRAGKPLVDPDSKEELGVETIYLGDARMVKYGEPATVEIRRIKQDVALDDRLIEPSDAPLQTFVPHAPDEQIRGRILSTYEGPSDVGKHSIVTINRGTADGIEEGHVLAIHRDGNVLPASKQKGVQKEGYVSLERNEDGSIKRDEQGRIQTRVGTRRVDGELDPKEIKLSDERIGLLMIFRTFERVSYGLVMQSERQIHAPDIVATP
jgi:hypothetical protein